MVEYPYKNGKLGIDFIKEDIVRLVYTKAEMVQEPSALIEPRGDSQTVFQSTESATETQTPEAFTLSTSAITLHINKKDHTVSCYNQKTDQWLIKDLQLSLKPINVIKYTTGGEDPIIERVKTVDGERNFIQNLKPQIDRKAYQAQIDLQWQQNEAIHGFGQAEEGIYDYYGHTQYLYQHNMRIPIPFFLSTMGYGMLFDCGSLMTGESPLEQETVALGDSGPIGRDHTHGATTGKNVTITLDTVDQVDFYLITGNTFDHIIAGFRLLTGKAVMLPRWAYGYVQSKEAYHTDQELVDVVKEYRRRRVPLDCIVQDWNTWEPGHWGEKTVDPTRYGNLANCLEQIHDMHVHTMVSVWPNMNPGGNNHTELFHAGHLLNDYSTYNAYSVEARKMYWNQAQEGLFDKGFDSWWCDSTEPFSGPDWGGPVKRAPEERYRLVGEEHKKYIDPAEANTFALYHAKGMYENQRAATEEKRVLNLTRSGYASSQKYGTVLWSGDIFASWETLRSQMREGLNFAMSGMPYWTLDIGAFFVVGSDAWQKRGCSCNTNPEPLWFWQGEYNLGVDDLAYRELYVRWLQYGTFLPMFRSHGTDTPREIWNFGEKGEPFYDAIEKFINLRYQLFPYIYTLASEVTRHGVTMLQSLLFDFLHDKTCHTIWNQFMFGKSLLICPITEPMYYKVGNTPITGGKSQDSEDSCHTRRCYLPQGTDWYDFWTHTAYHGGQWVDMYAPLDSIPIFVPAGSIIPFSAGGEYAAEAALNQLTVRVYAGKDAQFELYEDEGDSYRYEQGEFSIIPFVWNEQDRTLTIGQRQGNFAGMQVERAFQIELVGGAKGAECQRAMATYTGKAVTVKF